MRFFEKVDEIWTSAETRFGRGTVAILTGILFVVVAGLMCTPRFTPEHHGLGLTRLYIHPFDFSTEEDLRFRILSPLLGYLLFFRGVCFKYFMLIVLAIFYGVLYHGQRKNELRPSEAIGLTSLMAFSTLSFYQFYFPAYNDPTSFLLIALCLFYFRQQWLKLILPCLLLFNHENNIFLFPFFWLLFLDGNYRFSNLVRQGFGLLLSIIPYLIYRQWVLSHQTVEYDVAYYIDPKNVQWTREHVLPNLVSGIFQAFKLSWLIPAIAVYVDFKEKRFGEIALIVTGFVFVLSQMLVAYDISRLMGMCFPILIIAALRIRSHFGSEKFLFAVTALVLLNFFIPTYCIGALDPIPLPPFWMGW